MYKFQAYLSYFHYSCRDGCHFEKTAKGKLVRPHPLTRDVI